MRTLLISAVLVPASLVAMPAEAQQARGRPSVSTPAGGFRAPAMRTTNVSRPAGAHFQRPNMNAPRPPAANPPRWNNGGGGTPPRWNHGGGNGTPPRWNNGGGNGTPPRWNHGGGNNPPKWNNGGGNGTPPRWNHGGGNKPPKWNHGGGNNPRPPVVHPGRWGNKINGRWHGGWNAPGGWGGYQRPSRGWTLPSYWMGSGFLIGDYYSYGLVAPPTGYFWTRYYDDAVLVDSYGRVRDSVNGVSWDGAGDYYEGGYADGGYDDGGYADGGYAEDGYYQDGYYDEYAEPRGGYAPPVGAPPAVQVQPYPAAPCGQGGCGGSYGYQGGSYAYGGGTVSGGYYYPAPTVTTVVIQQAAPVVTTTVTETVEEVVTYAAPRRTVRRAAAPTKLRKRCAC